MLWVYVGVAIAGSLVALACVIRVVLWSFGQIAEAIAEVEETV